MEKKVVSLILGMLASAVMLPACGNKKAEPEEPQEPQVKMEKAEEEPEAEEIEGETDEEETKQEPEELDTDESPDEDEVIPGNSQSNAYLLPLNTKVFGTVKAGQYAWFSFTTGDSEEADYYATYVNMTAHSDCLHGYLFDELGTKLAGGSNLYDAYSGGYPVSLTSDTLKPDTTYYVRLESRQKDEDLDYSLIIKNPEDTTIAYKTI